MMNYAQSNLCRRTLFAQYFEDPDGVSSCGVCDNCERGLAAQVTDVSLSAWKVVRAAEEVHLHNGRVTLSGLADLVRGLNHAQFRKVDNSGAPHPAKMQLDLPSLGGKVTLSREVRTFYLGRIASALLWSCFSKVTSPRATVC